jgi:hypothetical protein
VTESGSPDAISLTGIGHLNAARISLAASCQAVWLGYIGVGGGAPLDQIERWMAGTDPLPDHEHNMLAQTLNDWFIDGGTTERVPYAERSGLARDLRGTRGLPAD